jgi:2-C-methyl-D-erythritol 4-phosphate cytidylyltransferase/2-C-methyl-D-erythritol 2,4-cyclodiphosphate synthase
LYDIRLFENATKDFNLADPVWGGKNRQESVFIGLQQLKTVNPTRVLIHDAARPFVSFTLISRVLSALNVSPAAIPLLPVTDTLKHAIDGQVVQTVSRDGLWIAQTPQGFQFNDILKAHKCFAGQSLTDDAALAENAGIELAIVEGSRENVKITTSQDLNCVPILQSVMETRTGIGYDVHAFGDGDHINLCGIRIAFDQGLVGHSDADVGLHALTDALLGAIGAGDIGEHFPQNDERWRNAASHQFARHALSLITERGGQVINVDLTLICQEPKISPHRKSMRSQLADILNVSPERVSVKATTTEGLGFTGRNEGIAAYAIACVGLTQ